MATATEVASKPGMPQLDLSTFPNQIFWLVVTLVVIYFVLSKIALPRIGGALAERAQTITDDLTTAEELKQKAVEAEAAYDKALAEARSEAQKIAAETRAEVQAQLDAELAKADVNFEELSFDTCKVEGKATFDSTPQFPTYEDHRMAMAFAPLAMLHEVAIEEPKVVEKSYPDY